MASQDLCWIPKTVSKRSQMGTSSVKHSNSINIELLKSFLNSKERQHVASNDFRLGNIIPEGRCSSQSRLIFWHEWFTPTMGSRWLDSFQNVGLARGTHATKVVLPAAYSLLVCHKKVTMTSFTDNPVVKQKLMTWKKFRKERMFDYLFRSAMT